MRCYFHLTNDDEELLDDTGIEVPDLETAKAEALNAISELRREANEAVQDWAGWWLNIVCPEGSLLHSMPLTWNNVLH
jgi:hypothetical protein